MNSVSSRFLGAAVLCLAMATAIGSAQDPATPPPASLKPAPQPKLRPVTSHANSATPAQDHNAVVRRYCVTCHNEKRKTGGLSLETFDVARAADAAPVAEK